jgi:RNA polymerase sigma factor (sigma-70 family)
MRDAEVVASVVADDPAGLAEAYDRYADPLYAYCWFMLDDSADAADAVVDTFLIAVSRLDRLVNPEYLRPWLYAVARNECLRQLRARQAVSAHDGAVNATAATVDITEGAERAELRMLVRSAVGGLSPSEREIIELHLGHGLEPAEIALVLGVSRNHAHSLLSRAGDQLQACLGVLLIGRAGRDDCDELNAMRWGWDGRLTVRLRKRVHRHIAQCATCASRRDVELRRATLPGMTSAATLAAVMAESTRLAGGAPAALRDHVLWTAAGQDNDALAHQADVRCRARAFGRRGFPKPLPVPKSGWHRSPQGQAAVAAGVAAAVVAAVVTLALTGNWLPAPAADPHSASNASAQPATPAAAAAAPAAAQRTPTPHTSASIKVAKVPVLAATHPTAKHPATTSPSATPSVRHLTTPASPSSTGTPAPSPPPPSIAPIATQTPTAPGTLVLSADTLDLTPFQPSGTITLTAENGPVTWSISQTDGPTGALVISPAEGLLAEGQSMQVTVTAESATPRFSAELTVSPGGQTVTVVYRYRHGSY